jgi:hypothetical protein
VREVNHSVCRMCQERVRITADLEDIALGEEYRTKIAWSYFILRISYYIYRVFYRKSNINQPMHKINDMCKMYLRNLTYA